jgi:4-amino-4-deoxy-L-arabinose transferase-like glycosyltransferase
MPTLFPMRILCGSIFSFFFVLGIWGVLYEDDMPLIGFFLAGVALAACLVIRRIFIRRKTSGDAFQR